MGREFGRLSTNVNNRIQFSISPFEQRVFPLTSLISHIPNTFRKISRNALVIAIPFYTAYWVKKWCAEENERFNRKKPEDFANDK